MGSMDINERSESGSTNQHADNTAVEGETGISLLEGQAEAPLTVSQPAAGETLEVPGEAGAVYLLDFDPADARITVEGQNLVLTFDSDGDGTADSRIVFLELAGMADASDAPVFQIAGVDYDIAGLVETALAFAEERGEDPGEAGQGPTLETAGGNQPALGGGATQYQDNTGSNDFSGGSDALSGVGGSLGGDVGPEVSSGTVVTGLPVVSGGRTQIVSTPESSDGGGGDTIEIVSGEVVDGYIANATVFRDANGNGQLDDGEVSTITDINGNFTLVGGSGPLVAVGGTDVSTGLAFEGVLKAPAGATVITPLTTLVEQLSRDGTQTVEDAEAAVKAAFGIADNFDLSNTDPIEAAAGNNAAALNVVKAGIQVANTAVQVQAALEGAGASDAEAASDAAFQAIAQQINDEGKNTDLGNSTQVTKVLNQASANHNTNTEETTTFDGNDVANATSVIAATNTVVETIDVETGSSTEVLTKLAQVAQVAQEGAADAIEDAVQNNDDNANNAFDSDGEIQTGANAANVGSVTGSETLDDEDNVSGPPPGATSGISIDGLGGNDQLTGTDFSDAISGGSGNDTINGGGGNDVLIGGSGNDSINGGAGDDDIVGGPGNDTIDGGSGTDIVRYGADFSSFTFAGGAPGQILITETASSDTDLVTNVEIIAFTDTNVLVVGADQPFENIQDAIDAAEAGDTILVLAGAYTETVTIDKQITLLGAAANNQAALTGAIILQDGADGTRIEGLTIAQGANIGGESAGIYLAAGAEDITIEDNAFTRSGDLDGNGVRGILTTSGGGNSGLTVSQNSFSGWATGVYLNPGATDAEVSGNIFDNNFVGMSVDGPDGTLITGNTFINNPYEALGLGPAGGVDASLKVTLTGNHFGDGNGTENGDRTIGVWTNGLQITTNAETAATTLELQPGISDIQLLGEGNLSVIGNDDDNDIEGNAGANLLDSGGGNDTIDGGDGNDTIDGGDGDDTATYRGDRSDFEIVATDDGGFTLTDTNPADGDEGIDTLIDVENIQFGDGTIRLGATLVRGVDESIANGGDEDSDNFHPGTGIANVNFAIHDNTEVEIEAAIKAKLRGSGDLQSDGLTYYTETGISSGSAGLWNFDYSVVDYGAADLSNYTIAITADFTDINGTTNEGILNFDPIQHRINREEAGFDEFYYQDPSSNTDGVQNSQNLGWQATDFDATTPGRYDFTLTVRDSDGNIVAETGMRVEVAPNITVGADGDYDNIQEAIENANEGDTILVLPGTYNENITIDKAVKLISAEGRDNTIIQGSSVGGNLGTIMVTNNTDGVEIGAANHGFTIIGYDVATPGLEHAALYFQGAHANATISGNDIRAEGEAGLLTEYAFANTDFVISDNVFSGQTFTGDTIANADFSEQFNTHNVPRALVFIGGNDKSGIVFEHNELTGTAGAPQDVSGTLFGNFLVTIDAENSSITGNSFTGLTYNFGLRARDTSTDIKDNTFDNSGDGNTNGVFQIFTDGEYSGNVFLGGAEADLFLGTAGADVMTGGEGNDTLVGGRGADTMVGGAGADSFTYTDVLEGGDLIGDFNAAEGDRVDLDALLDSLTVDPNDRAARVDIQQNASGEDATISIDSNGDATFDTVVATVTNVTGDLNNDSLILNVS